jgi:hypothetical protein
MGQVNSKHGGLITPQDGYSGYGFNENGDPVIINDQGTETPLLSESTSIKNIIANLGIGLEADLPTEPSMDDVYVTNDTYKIYTRSIGGEWLIESLQRGQLVTDVSEVTELPPVYQYYNMNLMPIANYVTTPGGGLPE